MKWLNIIDAQAIKCDRLMRIFLTEEVENYLSGRLHDYGSGHLSDLSYDMIGEDIS